jgi:hypothetical protein
MQLVALEIGHIAVDRGGVNKQRHRRETIVIVLEIDPMLTLRRPWAGIYESFRTCLNRSYQVVSRTLVNVTEARHRLSGELKLLISSKALRALWRYVEALRRTPN